MINQKIQVFRALSITLVVFTHCYNFSITTFGHNNEFYAVIIRNFISGASAFFVFISGFLFLKSYNSKSNYSNFLFLKVKKVYFPFLLFSSLDIIYLLIKVFFYKFTTNELSYTYYSSIISFDYISTYLFGKSFIMLGVLWYVPMIMIIYLLSPLYLLFAKLELNYRMIFFLVSAIIGLFLFRNIESKGFGIIQNVIYFTPYYLLGIIMSQKEVFSVYTFRIFQKCILYLEFVESCLAWEFYTCQKTFILILNRMYIYMYFSTILIE